MQKFRIYAILAASLLASSVLPAHSATLRFGAQGDVTSFDPYVIDETFSSGFLGNVYEGLVRRAADLSIEPALAESWETLSPTHWRFHLRKGVKFHDGSPFTADDVLFSAARIRAPVRISRTVFRRIPKLSRWTITPSISSQMCRTRSSIISGATGT